MQEKEIRQRMQQVLDSTVQDIASIRTGRANSSLVSEIEISAYGGTQKLRVMELANITTPDVETIVIDPWDKSIIGDIKKGIMVANIGMNPSIDGEIIRMALPALTAEDRGKLVKLLSVKLEAGRVAVRQIRAEAMKDIKEMFERKELSEDERKGEEKRVQEMTDEFVGKVNEVGERKEKELVGV